MYLQLKTTSIIKKKIETEHNNASPRSIKGRTVHMILGMGMSSSHCQHKAENENDYDHSPEIYSGSTIYILSDNENINRNNLTLHKKTFGVGGIQTKQQQCEILQRMYRGQHVW